MEKTLKFNKTTLVCKLSHDRGFFQDRSYAVSAREQGRNKGKQRGTKKVCTTFWPKISDWYGFWPQTCYFFPKDPPVLKIFSESEMWYGD